MVGWPARRRAGPSPRRDAGERARVGWSTAGRRSAGRARARVRRRGGGRRRSPRPSPRCGRGGPAPAPPPRPRARAPRRRPRRRPASRLGGARRRRRVIQAGRAARGRGRPTASGAAARASRSTCASRAVSSRSAPDAPAWLMGSTSASVERLDGLRVGSGSGRAGAAKVWRSSPVSDRRARRATWSTVSIVTRRMATYYRASMLLCPRCREPLADPPESFCPRCGASIDASRDVRTAACARGRPPRCRSRRRPSHRGSAATGHPLGRARTRSGFATALVETTRQVLRAPSDFFRRMRPAGGVGAAARCTR